MEKKQDTFIILATEPEKTPKHFFLPHADLKWSINIKPSLMLMQKGLKSLTDLSIYIKKFAEMVGIYPVNALKASAFCTFEEVFKTKAEKEHFLTKTLPEIAKAALSIETLFPSKKLPVLEKGRKAAILVERAAVVSLVACSFLCLYQEAQPDVEQISCTMELLHQNGQGLEMVEKMRSYTHYFNTVFNTPPEGHLLFARNVVNDDLHKAYTESKMPLCEVVLQENGTIEQNTDAVLMDFANKYIGGGFLQSGCVQEELMFLMYPELLVSRIFNEVMHLNEAILMKGAEEFCKIEGYAWDFKFKEGATDLMKTKKVKTFIDRDIVAFDAINFGYSSINQYCKESVIREIIKAHAGFTATLMIDPDCKKPISTGRWGCGAFGGDSQLKLIIQWLVASQNVRKMYFCSRADSALKEAALVIEKLKAMSVGELYSKLIKIIGSGKGVFKSLI